MRSRPSQRPRGQAGGAPAELDRGAWPARGTAEDQQPHPDRDRSAGRRRPASGARGADRRGLTAAGAVLLALAFGGAGAAIDLSSGRGLRLVFGVCFVGGCALAALLVHREDLKAVVVMPPLLHALIAGVTSALGRTTRSSTGVKGRALEAAVTLVLGAPVLLAATGAALLIAVLRAVTGRRRRGR